MLEEKDLQAIAQLFHREMESLNSRLDKQEKHAKSINKIVNSRLDYLEASIEKVDKRLAYNMELLKEAD